MKKNTKHRYESTKNGFCVSVRPAFLKDHSNPLDDRFVWKYYIRISNHTSEAIILMRRHWDIFDENGLKETVDGDGVVGEQPQIAPGESYEYASFVPLKTPSGMMMGWYDVCDENSEYKRIEIPAFSLDSPHHGLRCN